MPDSTSEVDIWEGYVKGEKKKNGIAAVTEIMSDHFCYLNEMVRIYMGYSGAAAWAAKRHPYLCGT